MAFSYPTQFCTNYSEAQAALIGISWYLNQRFESLEVELDSLMVVQMINGINRPPWRIQSTIDKIRDMITHKNIIVKHCYREANEVADALAKHATLIQELMFFTNERDLLDEVRGLSKWTNFNFRLSDEEQRRTPTGILNPHDIIAVGSID